MQLMWVRDAGERLGSDYVFGFMSQSAFTGKQNHESY